MRNTRKKLTAAALTLGLALGGAVVAAGPASAGTSIGATRNGATQLSFKYYASTDDFCLDAPSSVSHGNVFFAWPDSPKGSGVGGTSTVEPDDGWKCWDLKKLGFEEDERVRFMLISRPDQFDMSKTATSYGYLRV